MKLIDASLSHFAQSLTSLPCWSVTVEIRAHVRLLQIRLSLPVDILLAVVPPSQWRQNRFTRMLRPQWMLKHSHLLILSFRCEGLDVPRLVRRQRHRFNNSLHWRMRHIAVMYRSANQWLLATVFCGLNHTSMYCKSWPFHCHNDEEEIPLGSGVIKGEVERQRTTVSEWLRSCNGDATFPGGTCSNRPWLSTADPNPELIMSTPSFEDDVIELVHLRPLATAKITGMNESARKTVHFSDYSVEENGPRRFKSVQSSTAHTYASLFYLENIRL